MSRYIYPVITFGLAAFVTYSGYCAYKYTKQRSHAKYTYSLFESRLIEILQREASSSKSYMQLCELSSPHVRRDYFMKKIQAANLCMDAGDHEASVALLIEAMAVCSRPAALLQCMSNTLPITVYKKLIQKLSSLS